MRDDAGCNTTIWRRELPAYRAALLVPEVDPNTMKQPVVCGFTDASHYTCEPAAMSTTTEGLG